MSDSKRYRTKQQELILDYLSHHTGDAVTIESVLDDLRQSGFHIGQTTVYRALDRLVEDGGAVKVPAADGNRARYRYVGGPASPLTGKMVCLSCGGTQSLECSQLEALTRHIRADHQFAIDPRHTVLYGYCQACESKRK